MTLFEKALNLISKGELIGIDRNYCSGSSLSGSGNSDDCEDPKRESSICLGEIECYCLRETEYGLVFSRLCHYHASKTYYWKHSNLQWLSSEMYYTLIAHHIMEA